MKRQGREYWLASDWHFNHEDKMVEYCGRPRNYSKKILDGLEMLTDKDILIFLGDITIGNDAGTHGCLKRFDFTKILVRGNHDKKSNTWYLNHGWDFVAHSFTDAIHGEIITFSHKPITIPSGSDGINIHGHFHNSDHRRHEPELKAIYTKQHRLVCLEDLNYQPIKLQTFLHKTKGQKP
jgi:calcineurin-like phosphoesterase family protein